MAGRHAAGVPAAEGWSICCWVAWGECCDDGLPTSGLWVTSDHSGLSGHPSLSVASSPPAAAAAAADVAAPWLPLIAPAGCCKVRAPRAAFEGAAAAALLPGALRVGEADVLRRLVVVAAAVAAVCCFSCLSRARCFCCNCSTCSKPTATRASTDDTSQAGDCLKAGHFQK